MKKNTPITTKDQSSSNKYHRALQMINPSAAFVDIGSGEHWVCIPGDCCEKNVRKYGAFTSKLYEIKEWLLEHKITTVAMESTGVYWIPLFQILEEAMIEVLLVNARDLKSVKGRPKTDKLDCQWGQRLHSYGLLKASFRPSARICEMRSIWRMRKQLVQEMSRTIQRMQKSLHEMNILLPKVISDITGKTGMSIIEAIIKGEQDPVKLAQLRDPRVRASTEEIAEALRGDYRSEHIFLITKALEHYRFIQGQLLDYDEAVKERLENLEKVKEVNDSDKAKNDKEHKKYKKRYPNAPSFDSRTLSHEILGIDLGCVPGLSSVILLGLLLEIGPDLTKWPDAGHFASWLGLCPNPRKSGGKDLGTRTKKCRSRAAGYFRLAAASLRNSQCYLGDFYRRMQGRHGQRHAITATAHKLAVLFYKLVKEGEQYKEVDRSEYQEAMAKMRIASLKKRARLLGFELTPVQEKAS